MQGTVEPKQKCFWWEEKNRHTYKAYACLQTSANLVVHPHPCAQHWSLHFFLSILQCLASIALVGCTVSLCHCLLLHSSHRHHCCYHKPGERHGTPFQTTNLFGFMSSFLKSLLILNLIMPFLFAGTWSEHYYRIHHWLCIPRTPGCQHVLQGVWIYQYDTSSNLCVRL